MLLINVLQDGISHKTLVILRNVSVMSDCLSDSSLRSVDVNCRTDFTSQSTGMN